MMFKPVRFTYCLVLLFAFLGMTANLEAIECEYTGSNSTSDDVEVTVTLVGGAFGTGTATANTARSVLLNLTLPVCPEIEKVTILGVDCFAGSSCNIGPYCVTVTANTVEIEAGPC